MIYSHIFWFVFFKHIRIKVLSNFFLFKLDRLFRLSIKDDNLMFFYSIMLCFAFINRKHIMFIQFLLLTCKFFCFLKINCSKRFTKLLIQCTLIYGLEKNIYCFDFYFTLSYLFANLFIENQCFFCKIRDTHTLFSPHL